MSWWSLILGDCAQGDIVLIGSTKWTIMSPMRAPKGKSKHRDGCFLREDGVGPRAWFMDSTVIDELLVVNRERFVSDKRSEVDPMDLRADDSFNWKGTRK